MAGKFRDPRVANEAIAKTKIPIEDRAELIRVCHHRPDELGAKTKPVLCQRMKLANMGQYVPVGDPFWADPALKEASASTLLINQGYILYETALKRASEAMGFGDADEADSESSEDSAVSKSTEHNQIFSRPDNRASASETGKSAHTELLNALQSSAQAIQSAKEARRASKTTPTKDPGGSSEIKCLRPGVARTNEVGEYGKTVCGELGH